MSGFQLCNEFEPKLLPKMAIGEIKFDGTMAKTDKGKLFNRGKRNITYQYPEIILPDDLELVGEICIFENGVSKFNHILKRNVDNPSKIRLLQKVYPAYYMVFDILEDNGEDISSLALKERRNILENLDMGENSHIIVAQKWDIKDFDDLDGVLDLVREYRLEGLIIKDLTKPYVAERSDNWLKLKAWKDRVFEIDHYEITDNNGFVIIIHNKGREQKVVANSIDMQQRILRGYKFAHIRFLEESDEGALRQPSLKEVRRDGKV